MERSKAGTKEKRSHDSRNYPNQNTIIINITWYHFTRYEKNRTNFNLQKTKWTRIIEK